MADSFLSGLTNKKNLAKWDGEDTDRLYKCEWIKRFDFKEIKNKRERKRYYEDIYDKLVGCLPKPELQYMEKRLSLFSTIRNRDKFESLIRYVVSDMRRKLVAHEYQKEKVLNSIQSNSTNEITFNEYRANQLVQKHPKNSVEEKNQKYNSSPGYYPIMEVLIKLPPIEIIDYVGFRLIKYDIFNGYYAVILRYPKDVCKLPEIMYNTDAQILESEAEYKFDEEVNKYIQSKSNPYGDKTYNTVDISNIEQVMGGGDNNINPLDEDIF